MNLELTPALEAYVQRKFSSGSYASHGEVLREALRLLMEQESAKEAHIEGIRSGVSGKLPFDCDEPLDGPSGIETEDDGWAGALRRGPGEG